MEIIAAIIAVAIVAALGTVVVLLLSVAIVWLWTVLLKLHLQARGLRRGGRSTATPGTGLHLRS